MAFLLKRGAKNIAAEVQRWQYFLLRMNIPQVGSIDGDFGHKTETATRFYQVQNGLTPTGKLDDPTLQRATANGYTVVPDDYYDIRSGTAFPVMPANLTSPSNDSRNDLFTCFNFLQHSRPPRPDAEAIIIKDACDGSAGDWVAAKIIEVDLPQLRFARGYHGRFRCHAKAVGHFRRLFEAWETADLLHLIISYDGCFVPRYIRKRAPHPTKGHPAKSSREVSALSNHSFGSAFDINFTDNQLGEVPALCGQRGSVRELVEAANAEGVFWGGHFARLDGMHFEISASTE